MTFKFIHSMMLFCLIQVPYWAQEEALVADTLVTFTLTEELHSGSEVFPQTTIRLDPRSGSTDLSGVMSQQSSVYIKDGGPGVLASSGFRGGTAQQQLLLWNGMSINSSSLGLTDLHVLPIFLFDAVEMSSGPGALIKGDGALGMALDLRNTGIPQRLGLQFNVNSVPQLDKVFNTFSLSEKIGRTYLTFGAYKGEAENRYLFMDHTLFRPELKKREHAAEDQWGWKTDLVHFNKKKGRFQLSVQSSEMRREVPAVLGTTPHSEELGDDHRRAIFLWNDTFAGFQSELAIGIAEDEQFYTDSLADIHSTIRGQNLHSRWILSRKFNRLGTIKVKLNADRSEVKTSNYEESHERATLAAFLEWEKKMGDLTINTAFRQSWVDSRNLPNTGALGLKYDLGSWSLYASAGRTYRIPTFNDLYWNPGGNPELLPEQGWTSQIGIGKEDGYLSWQVIYFRNDLQDMIVWIPSNLGYWTPLNRTVMKNHGIEASISMNLHEHWQVNGSVTYTELRSWKEGNRNLYEEGLRPLYTPRYQAQYSLSYASKNDHLSLAQRLNGEVFTDNSNQRTVKASFPIDLSYNHRFSSDRSRLDLGFRIMNLLNEDYESVKGRPLPKRLFQIELRIYLNTHKT